MEININDCIYFLRKRENPFKDRVETEEDIRRQKEFENEQKRIKLEQERKWHNWLNSNFPADYEWRRKFAYMSIEELADYFIKHQDIFEIWQDFIEERCNAEEPFGYSRFCSLVRTKREIAKITPDPKTKAKATMKKSSRGKKIK